MHFLCLLHLQPVFPPTAVPTAAAAAAAGPPAQPTGSVPPPAGPVATAAVDAAQQQPQHGHQRQRQQSKGTFGGEIEFDIYFTYLVLVYDYDQVLSRGEFFPTSGQGRFPGG